MDDLKILNNQKYKQLNARLKADRSYWYHRAAEFSILIGQKVAIYSVTAVRLRITA